MRRKPRGAQGDSSFTFAQLPIAEGNCVNRLMAKETPLGNYTGLAKPMFRAGFARNWVVCARVIGYKEDRSTKDTKKREANPLSMEVGAVTVGNSSS